MHRDILIIKSTKCTNFSNLFFGIKLYMFRTVPLSHHQEFSLCTQPWFADILRAGSDGSSSALILYDIYHGCVHSENSS